LDFPHHVQLRIHTFQGLPTLLSLVLLLALGFTPLDNASANGVDETVEAHKAVETEKNTCIACHGNKTFLVRNKKLYDYFKQWEISIHSEDDITCDDCHGGNPQASKKEDSHAKGVASTDEASGIYFTNVSETCGDCHGEILEGFKESEHFKHVVAEKQEDQGPTCVTCHGSINVEILDVASVAESCVRCHNEESDNHPENPEKAEHLINRFLSISHYYRYLSHRVDPSESQAFFKEVDEKLGHLSITWHTFDLDAIEVETKDVLDQLKTKRDEIKKKSKTAPSE
jgi:hypothetical protein